MLVDVLYNFWNVIKETTDEGPHSVYTYARGKKVFYTHNTTHVKKIQSTNDC